MEVFFIFKELLIKLIVKRILMLKLITIDGAVVKNA